MLPLLVMAARNSSRSQFICNGSSSVMFVSLSIWLPLMVSETAFALSWKFPFSASMQCLLCYIYTTVSYASISVCSIQNARFFRGKGMKEEEQRNNSAIARTAPDRQIQLSYACSCSSSTSFALSQSSLSACSQSKNKTLFSSWRPTDIRLGENVASGCQIIGQTR